MEDGGPISTTIEAVLKIEWVGTCDKSSTLDQAQCFYFDEQAAHTRTPQNCGLRQRQGINKSLSSWDFPSLQPKVFPENPSLQDGPCHSTQSSKAGQSPLMCSMGSDTVAGLEIIQGSVLLGFGRGCHPGTLVLHIRCQSQDVSSGMEASKSLLAKI